MNQLTNFKLWLKTKKYNPGTIRNYICDINRYLRYVKKHYPNSPNILLLSFSEEAYRNYILYILGKKNYLRYFTSLARYSRFAYEKDITPQDIFKSVRKQVIHHRNTLLDPVLQMYQTNLIRQNKAYTTIKNYINDIQQFINWSEPVKNGLK